MTWKYFRRGALAGLIFSLIGQLMIWLSGDITSPPGVGAWVVVAITVAGSGLAAAAISVGFATADRRTLMAGGQAAESD